MRGEGGRSQRVLKGDCSFVVRAQEVFEVLDHIGRPVV